jgi:hypothetical protein
MIIEASAAGRRLLIQPAAHRLVIWLHPINLPVELGTCREFFVLPSFWASGSVSLLAKLYVAEQAQGQDSVLPIK